LSCGKREIISCVEIYAVILFHNEIVFSIEHLLFLFGFELSFGGSNGAALWGI